MTKTDQVPESLREICIPGFSSLYLSGHFGYVFSQSAIITGIEMHHLTGELTAEFRGRTSLPASGLAVWIPLEGRMLLEETDMTLTTLPNHSLCLASGINTLALRTEKKGSVSGVLLLFPRELIVSILSFYPRLNDLRTSLEEDKSVLSVHAHTGAALLEKLYTLMHTPLIPSMQDFYRHALIQTAHQAFSGLSSDAPEVLISLQDIACIHKARDYIDEHLSVHFSIRQIARYAGINELKLKTGFREVYGAGLYGYLREQRLIAARTALADSRLPLKEISRRAGYQSVSNFCTAYKRQFGMTPGQLRKQKGRK